MSQVWIAVSVNDGEIYVTAYATEVLAQRALILDCVAHIQDRIKGLPADLARQVNRSTYVDHDRPLTEYLADESIALDDRVDQARDWFGDVAAIDVTIQQCGIKSAIVDTEGNTHSV